MQMCIRFFASDFIFSISIKGEDAIVNEKKKVAESIRNDCDAELTEVNAVIDGALDAIATLTQSEIAAVRGVKTPSNCLKLNMEVICILKNIKPDRIADPAGEKKSLMFCIQINSFILSQTMERFALIFMCWIGR